MNSSSTSSTLSTVAVIGANGKTGRKIVELLVNSNISTLALTRDGLFNPNQLQLHIDNINMDKLNINKVDVKDLINIVEVLKTSHICIFAASSSKYGGTPYEVDQIGLINVAKACQFNKVIRLVIISSAAVTKKFSFINIFLNLFHHNIMNAKLEGEMEVRRLYSLLEPGSRLGYTIIRPGKLIDTNDESSKGCSNIELNQGDNIVGDISYLDLAILCIESMNCMYTFNVTFECYYKNHGKSNVNFNIWDLFKLSTKNEGNVKRGEDYNQLFQGLITDF